MRQPEGAEAWLILRLLWPIFPSQVTSLSSLLFFAPLLLLVVGADAAETLLFLAYIPDATL